MICVAIKKKSPLKCVDVVMRHANSAPYRTEMCAEMISVLQKPFKMGWKVSLNHFDFEKLNKISKKMSLKSFIFDSSAAKKKFDRNVLCLDFWFDT